MSFTYEPQNHCLHLLNGLIDPDETLEKIKAKYHSFDPAAKKVMVVHFHGGLAGRKAGSATAELLATKCYGDVAFPVFFVWESGLVHSLTETAKDILQKKLFFTVFEHVSEFLEGKIGGLDGKAPTPSAKARSTGDILHELEREIGILEAHDAEAFSSILTLTGDEETRFRSSLQKKLETGSTLSLPEEPLDGAMPVAQATFHQTPQDVDATIDPMFDAATLDSLSPLIKQSMGQERIGLPVDESLQALPTDIDSQPAAQAAGIGSAISIYVARAAFAALRNTLARLASKRDHGIQATIVEEILRALYVGKIGRDTWLTMKAFTAAAFGPTERAGAVPGGTAFLNFLAELKDKGPERIVLVGHSTGAVYICHFLNAARKLMPNRQFEVIFLAPACDFKLLNDTLAESESSVSELRIFAMNDTLEHAEALFDIDELRKPGLQLLTKTYPGSLLYFVSGALEDEADKPIVGMQRFYNDTFAASEKYPEIASLKERLAKFPNSLVWSLADDDDGLKSACTSHGGFDDEPKTLASLQFIIEKGFASAKNPIPIDSAPAP